jgi:hypothetical protein
MSCKELRLVQEQVPRVLAAMADRMIDLGLTLDDGVTKTQGWFGAVLRVPTGDAEHPFDWVEWKFPINGADKTRQSFAFCVEKPRRILEFDLISSFQRRDPINGQWGGGIRVSENLAIAASGFPEESDQALTLCFALSVRLIGEERLAEVLSIAGREAYEALAA